MGDSLAVLLRVPERGHQPANLERRGDDLGAGMAPIRSVDRIAIKPHDRRDRGLRGHSGAVRTSPSRCRRSGPRRPHCRALRCSRGRDLAHMRPGLLSVSGAAYTQSFRAREYCEPLNDAFPGSSPAGFALFFRPFVEQGFQNPRARTQRLPQHVQRACAGAAHDNARVLQSHKPWFLDHAQVFLYGSEGGVGGAPNRRRLVCNIEGGGKVAIWGREGARHNIDAILTTGLPCTVECEYSSPNPNMAQRFGHTHWVPQDARLRILKDRSTRGS